jgi:LmbE family N-acetylglucosaminyl deacetylase
MNNSVAVIVAHPDDEVLGCGGSIAHFIGEGRSVHTLILADGISSRTQIKNTDKTNAISSRNIAAETAHQILGTTSLTQLSLPDNRMDQLDLLDVVKLIENFIELHQPSTVLTHHAGDVNIDHRVVHDAVIAACRPQPFSSVRELLFFEIPSSTEWRPPTSGSMFLPNYFLDISDFMTVKIQALKAYKAELREFPHPRSIKAVEALAIWRGSTVGVCAAEAFILGRKIITKEQK